MRQIRAYCGFSLLVGVCTIWAVEPTSESLPELRISAAPIVEGSHSPAYGGWVTRVGADQIEDLNAQDLASALRRTPGVTISRYNRIGSFGGADGGAVFIRGQGSTRPGAEIVTMIDGVPVSNPVWNHPLLDLNPIDAAQVIEVFKGPHPAEFGNAFSAVNMIPPIRMESGVATRLQLVYGPDATAISGMDHLGLRGPLDWGIGGWYRTSDGHRPEAHGRLGDIRLRLGYDLDAHWRASGFLLRTDNRASDPGPEGNPGAREGIYETRNWLGLLKLSHAYESVTGMLAIHGTKGDGEWYDQAGPADDTLNDWETLGIRWQENVELAKQTRMRVGMDYDVTYGEASFTTDAGAQREFSRTRLALVSPYMAVEHTLGDRAGVYAVPSAGIRAYEHTDFDSEWAPHAGLRIGHGNTEWHVSYARGVVYPGLNVIVFSENVLAPLGTSWETLHAERVDHWEAGVTQTFDNRIEASLTAFYDNGKDRYVFYRDAPTPGPPNRWDNVEEFEIRGLEAELRVSPSERLSFFFGVTALDADPADLPYTPDWTVSTGLNVEVTERIDWSIDAEYVDDMPVLAQARLRDTLNTVSVGSHILINTKLSMDVNLGKDRRGTVFVAVENLTDTDYEYLPDYPMPGITPMVGMDVAF